MKENEGVIVPIKIRRQRRLRVSRCVSALDKTEFSCIRFAGQYLNALGFDPNGFFDLFINDDKSITIRAVKDDEKKEPVAEQSSQ